MFWLGGSQHAFASFGFYSPVTVNSAQVPSAQSNFPMLVSYTDNRLKTVGNGGHVQNANGYDIRPYSDSSLSTALTYELESYDGSAGTVVMWVKIPSINVGSVVYLAYGDASLSSDGSSSSTWSNGYVEVLHMNDNAASTAVTAEVGGNGVSNNNTSSMTTAGKIGKSLSFIPANSDAVNFDNKFTATGGEYTIDFWSNPGGSGAFDTMAYNLNVGRYWIYSHDGGNWGGNTHAVSVADSVDGSNNLSATNSVPDSTWTHVVITLDASGNVSKAYINGVLDPSTNVFTGMDFNGAGILFSLMATYNQAGSFAQGILDQWTFSTTVRSANWIATEYNNESAPSTFATLGTEVSNTTTAIYQPVLALFQGAFNLLSGQLKL